MHRSDRRRRLLQAVAGATLAGPALATPFALTRRKGRQPAIEGDFSDTALTRGHRLRDPDNRLAPLTGPVTDERVAVLIIGAGIAGLAAARALRARGIDDYRILELDDQVGGNSRAASVGGLPCPAGAHYLPIPGPAAGEVAALLTELGVRDAAGRYDERMRVHSPQERLFIHGVWQDGLLPQVAQAAGARNDRQRFAEAVEGWRRRAAFAMPSARARADDRLAPLVAITFRQWLDDRGLHDEGLRWFLDYCCRDDYGAGIDTVSAWAGLHYFASRHGFAGADDGDADPGSADPGGAVPFAGDGPAVSQQGMLTWPQGNGWLAARLAEPHAPAIRTGVMVTRVQRQSAGDREGLLVEGLRFDRGSARAMPVVYRADQVIWAAPAFVAARVLDPADPTFAGLREAAGRLRYAPWVVANLLFDDERVDDWPDLNSEPPAWDNVLYRSKGLGYVDARHQRLDRKGGARLWTWYCSLGDDPQGRAALYAARWQDWVEAIAADLRPAHPDLLEHLRRVEVHRWGHAMVIPTPGLAGSDILQRLREPAGRLRLAHADLAGYSVFEEALYWGNRAGDEVAGQLGRG